MFKFKEKGVRVEIARIYANCRYTSAVVGILSTINPSRLLNKATAEPTIPMISRMSLLMSMSYFFLVRYIILIITTILMFVL